MNIKWQQLDFGLLVAILLPLIVWLPTATGDGIAAGADVEVHVHRIHAMTLSLQQGELYPRWISYLHLGYGYPIFNYYAPGATYLTSLLEFIGLHITTAWNLVNLLAWSFGSAGMYLLSRRFFPASVALLSAALWVFAPSRLYEVWWQGSIAQIVSAGFIPWLLWGILRTTEQPTRRNLLLVAFPFAGLIFTHTPMTYISALYAAPLAFVAPLWHTWTHNAHWQEVIRRWFVIGCGFVLGVGLTTIFLMPTLLELDYVLISEGIDETLNYLREQYLPASEIFAWPRLLDRTDIYLDFPRTLGLVGGLLSAVGLIALLYKRKSGLFALLLAGLGFTVFMLLDVSYPVWLAIPSFENLRFPARLLRMGAVLVALLGSVSLLLLPKRYQLIGAALGITLALTQIMPVIRPYDSWLNWDNISAVDEIQHEAEDYTWGTVSYNEFNPIWGERIFHDVPTGLDRYRESPFHLRVFGRDIAALNWQGLSEENIAPRTLRVTTDEARALRFRQYYFPGWQATLNGSPVEIYPDDEIGLITMDVPAGEHIITLDYAGTPLQQIATLITLTSAAVCLLLFITGTSNSKSPVTNTRTDDRLSLTSAGVFIGSIVLFALVNQTIVLPGNTFSYQSPPDDPHYMQRETRMTFTDAERNEQIQLIGYTLHSEFISPTNPLHLDLYWHTPEAIETNYRPVVQLLSWNQQEARAVSQPLDPAAGKTSTFTPDRFARDPHTLRLIREDVPPYIGQISVQMLNPDGDALTLPNGSDRLLLQTLIPVQTVDDSAPATLNYNLGGVVTLRCAGIEPGDGTHQITLYWDLQNNNRQNVSVMVHGLDANDELVTTGDAPPFDGMYPSPYWRSNQTLRDTYTLPADPNITQIAVGMYVRETLQRLTVTDEADNPVPNNQILLPLERQSCSP